MKINENELFEVVNETIKDINSELHSLNGSGIYFAPELHVSFEIGKAIYKNREQVFNTPDIIWSRERNLLNGGPTDIIFEKKNGEKSEIIAVMEIKLRDTVGAYKADIEKMLALDIPSCAKYFCVLPDSFYPERDERLQLLEEDFNLTLLGRKPFQVNQDWYKTPVNCLLSLYRVGEILT